MASTSPPTSSTEMVFPDQSNHYGTLFGGNALNLLSKSAFLCATRHARHHVVMAACKDVQFHAPVKVGQALELTAQVVRSGRSSMSVEVSGMAENLMTGKRMLAVQGRFEMVTVDTDGKPVAFQSPLSTETSS